MRVIPVLDVRHGLAVHAVAGDRDHYRPVVSRMHEAVDPVGLAGGFRDVLGLDHLYLADLDAIVDRVPPRVSLYRSLAELGLTLAVDAGIRVAADVEPLLDIPMIVVGLETVEGPVELARIVDRVGPDRVVFSLDLVDGRPMVETRGRWGTDEVCNIVDTLKSLDICRVLQLDLARVGTGRGVAPVVAASAGGVEWWIGGGVSGPGDLGEIAGAGYSAVLVGSALHDGRITRDDLSGRRTS